MGAKTERSCTPIYSSTLSLDRSGSEAATTPAAAPANMGHQAASTLTSFAYTYGQETEGSRLTGGVQSFDCNAADQNTAATTLPVPGPKA